MSMTNEGVELWDNWLHSSLAYLQESQLMRTLRPTVWCNSSREAFIHQADLRSWLAGTPPVVQHYDHCGSLKTYAATIRHPDPSTGFPLHDLARPAAASHGPATPAKTEASSQALSAAAYDPKQTPEDVVPDWLPMPYNAESDSDRCPAVGSDGGIPGRVSSAGDSGGRKLSGGSGSGSDGDGCSLVRLRLFSLNDYLGLASHPEVAAAAALAATQVGLGPRSSALVAGYTHSHRQLEEGLAALKGTQDCLLFPTGFGANLAVLTSLAAASPVGVGAGGGWSRGGASGGGGGVAIFSDELNHASIIDGARLATRGGGSPVQLHVYRHNDMRHLEELLAATPPRTRRLVAADSLFSMDGDFADLKGLVELKRRHPFLLALDEAHATLVCGETGSGAAEAMGVAHEVDVHIGTLSKAFGSLGGFVACSRGMKTLLLNRGRSFVYSTSLPVPVVEAAASALHVSQRESWRRLHVWSLVRRLGRGLGVPALSPVVPLVVGEEGPTLALSGRLLAAGLHVPAIRPPTVPRGTCRLRVSLSAAHTTADVDELIHLVRQSAVPLVQLPHLLDSRAALPPGPLSGDCGGAGQQPGGGGGGLHSRL